MLQATRSVRCLALVFAVAALSGCQTGSLFGPRYATDSVASSSARLNFLRRLRPKQPAPTLDRSTRRSGQAASLPQQYRLRAEVAWRPETLRLPEAPRLRSGSLLALETEVARWIADEKLLFYPPAPARPWQYIVLHHSASESDSLETIDRFHREVRGWDGCGYHFVIGNGTYSGDGEIEVSRRWLEQKHGAHTKVAGHPEYNRYGIGICLVGNFEQHPPTPKQTQAARALVAYLMARYNIPPSRVSLHRVLAGGRTACPGSQFPTHALLPNYWQ